MDRITFCCETEREREMLKGHSEEEGLTSWSQRCVKQIFHWSLVCFRWFWWVRCVWLWSDISRSDISYITSPHSTFNKHCITSPFALLFLMFRDFKMFLYSLCSPRLRLFDQKYSKYYYNLNICFLCEYLLNCNLFLSSKLNFQSSVSHDSSEIIIICWFAAQETFLIIINVENSCAAQYFCGNCDTFYFSGFTDEQKVKKISIYLKWKSFVTL